MAKKKGLYKHKEYALGFTIKMPTLTVIVPFYNESPVNLFPIREVCKKFGIKLLVIDDGSTDLLPLGVFPEGEGVFRHKKNKGYGASIKTGIREAKTTHVAIIDSDGQYDIFDILRLWRDIGDEDQLIGQRIIHRGSPKRLFGRMFLKLVSSIIAGKYIPDLNSGVRIMKRSLANKYASIICNEISASSSYTLSFILDGYNVKWKPIFFYPRKGAKSSVKELRHGLMTLFYLVKIGVGLRTRRLRRWLKGK